MKSLTFSCLICSERQNLPEVARTATKLLQTPKVAQNLPSTIGKGLRHYSTHPYIKNRLFVGHVNCVLTFSVKFIQDKKHRH